MEKHIILYGQSTVVRCDGKCNKAWGVNIRPRNADTDEYLSDAELDTAPADPGTYEGACGKPFSGICDDSESMNKWCVRQCERSYIDNDPIPCF